MERLKGRGGACWCVTRRGASLTLWLPLALPAHHQIHLESHLDQSVAEHTTKYSLGSTLLK